MSECLERKTLPPTLTQQLAEPLPAEAIQAHPTKAYLSTIKTIYAVDRLNAVFGLGGWTYRTEIIENSAASPMVVMKVRLLVPEYGIDLEQYGGNNNEDRGDAYKGAVTDALSKLCSYLGIGMDVYKGFGPTKSEPQRKPPARRPVKPVDASSEPSPSVPPVPAPVAPPAPSAPEPNRQKWFALSRDERIQSFRDLERVLPPDVYYGTLESHGVSQPNQFKSANMAWNCFEKLFGLAVEHRRKQADPTRYEHFVAQEGSAA